MTKAVLTDEMTDELLETVLRASGTSLRHYSLQKSKDDMRTAMRSVIERALQASATEQQATVAPEVWIDECMSAAHQWAQAAYCKAVGKMGPDIDASKKKLRDLLSAAQPSAPSVIPAMGLPSVEFPTLKKDAAPVAEPTEALKTWPERIWLQHSEDKEVPMFAAVWPSRDEITWCQDKQFPGDVEYIRAALATPPAPAIPESLSDAIKALCDKPEVINNASIYASDAPHTVVKKYRASLIAAASKGQEDGPQ